MGRLTRLPQWVRPPVRAVARTEDFLLWLVGRTPAPQALGSWNSLAWLAGVDGEGTPGPVTRRGSPREVVAWAEMWVANRIADGEPYPSPTWWARHGVEECDRMPPEQWAAWITSPAERHFAHGTVAALGWLLGEVTDPGLMAPLRRGDSTLIPPEDRAQYEKVLRALSEPTVPHPVA